MKRSSNSFLIRRKTHRRWHTTAEESTIGHWRREPLLWPRQDCDSGRNIAIGSVETCSSWRCWSNWSRLNTEKWRDQRWRRWTEKEIHWPPRREWRLSSANVRWSRRRYKRWCVWSRSNRECFFDVHWDEDGPTHGCIGWWGHKQRWRWVMEWDRERESNRTKQWDPCTEWDNSFRWVNECTIAGREWEGEGQWREAIDRQSTTDTIAVIEEFVSCSKWFDRNDRWTVMNNCSRSNIRRYRRVSRSRDRCSRWLTGNRRKYSNWPSTPRWERWETLRDRYSSRGEWTHPFLHRSATISNREKKWLEKERYWSRSKSNWSPRRCRMSITSSPTSIPMNDLSAEVIINSLTLLQFPSLSPNPLKSSLTSTFTDHGKQRNTTVEEHLGGNSC